MIYVAYLTLEILERPWISKNCFPGLESPGNLYCATFNDINAPNFYPIWRTWLDLQMQTPGFPNKMLSSLFSLMLSSISSLMPQSKRRYKYVVTMQTFYGFVNFDSEKLRKSLEKNSWKSPSIFWADNVQTLYKANCPGCSKFVWMGQCKSGLLVGPFLGPW